MNLKNNTDAQFYPGPIKTKLLTGEGRAMQHIYQHLHCDSNVQPNLRTIDSENTVALLFSTPYVENSGLDYFYMILEERNKTMQSKLYFSRTK